MYVEFGAYASAMLRLRDSKSWVMLQFEASGSGSMINCWKGLCVRTPGACAG